MGQARVDLLLADRVLRELVGRDLDRVAGPIAHEQAPVAVDDLAARRLDVDLAHAVVVGLGQVAVPGEDLQVPEAEEDDAEHHERGAADDGDADRELRGDRRPAV
jgi:hypothetical protein